MDGDREFLQPASSNTATITTNQRDAGTEDFTFSSPLTVRVRKEVAREMKEEIDLETGTTRRWVVEKEFEVLDLTGEK